MNKKYDIVVVGAGVVGAAIARDLSRYHRSVALLEGQIDFGNGSSKGNSALLTSGCDTPANTLERKLVTRGYERYLKECPKMGLPIKKIGAVMIAWTKEQIPLLDQEYRKAKASGFPISRWRKDQLYKKVPYLGEGALAAIHFPNEAIIDPFNTVSAYVQDAVCNGVDYISSFLLQVVEKCKDGFVLHCSRDSLKAGIVINCAGLYGDKVDSMAGFKDFVIKPRRGQFLLFDKLANHLLPTTLFPTPTAVSRGILVTPTIFGNILVGPTAEDVADLNDTKVDQKTLDRLMEYAIRVIPEIKNYHPITSWAGMRPASDREEYRIIPRLKNNWITVGGIRSTGLSGALGISEYIMKILSNRLGRKKFLNDIHPVHVHDFSYKNIRPWTKKNAPIEAFDVVCHCEGITLMEVKAILNEEVPPGTLKGLKRRSRCGYGRCQSFFCGGRLEKIMEKAIDVRKKM